MEMHIQKVRRISVQENDECLYIYVAVREKVRDNIETLMIKVL